MIFVNFIEGLAFFVMGVLALFLIQKQSGLKITGSLGWLGAFGIFWGLSSWGEMFLILPVYPQFLLMIFQAATITIASFSLCSFGYKLLQQGYPQKPLYTWVLACLAAGGIIYIGFSVAYGLSDWRRDINLFNRHFLGLAGAFISAAALYHAAGEIIKAGFVAYGKNFKWASLLFMAQGLLNIDFINLSLYYLQAPVALGLTYHLVKGFLVYGEEERRRLYNKAVTDELTGLHNHRYFQERLEGEIARSRRHNLQTSLIMLDIDYFKIYNDTHGHPIGDNLLKDLAVIMKRSLRDMDVIARYGGEEFGIILPNAGSRQAFEVAERIRQEVEDYPFYGKELQPNGKLTISLGVATFPADAPDKDNLIKMADVALYKAKERRNQVETYFSVLDDLKGQLDSSELGIINTFKTLITVINAVDHYTYGHSERVVDYAAKIANKLGLADKEVKLIKYGAFLHDIGKIEIDRNLLSKTGSLSGAEQKVLRQHPSLGAEIIRPIKPLRQVVPYILYHQEHYDGQGYPEGLKGGEIPLGARIIAVADSFDAMTTTRPFKKGKSLAEAMAELKKCSGTQFDPMVVEAFLTIIEKDERSNQDLVM